MRTFAGISTERLAEWLDRFPSARIGVLGDFFLDKYLDVDPALAEVSVETGKPAHQVTSVRHSPGAAGTIVRNLASLEAGTLHAIGFTGDDGESYDLRGDLRRLGCRTEHLHMDPARMTPTYLKPRDRGNPSLAGEHSRYDTKNRVSTSAATERRIVDSLDSILPELDALIVADQVEEENCGAVTAEVRRTIADRAERHPDVIFWADSRHRIRRFRNVIVKPNQFEVVGRSNPQPGDVVSVEAIRAAISQLRNEVAGPVCVTRGSHGMVVSDPELTLVAGVAVDGPIDSTGAGDSATAGAVLALASGATLPEAALVGNLVASITVGQLATTGTARREQLPERLLDWNAQFRL